MDNLNDSLVENKSIKQNKCTIRCCKLLFFLVCNGLSFTAGYLLNNYLEHKDLDGSL